jgi:hypothetical protein
MTDIKRHLPHVFKVVQTTYRRESAPDKSIVYAQIRELLPDSYAVTSGCLQNPTAARSASLDLILLDKTIGLTNPVENDVRQALAFFSFAHKPNWAEFAELLQSIASAKRLRPAKAPLGILFCQGIAEPPEYADFCLRLTNELKKLPMAERPDYIFLVEQSLSYRNPALDGQIATQDEYISGWGRDPKLTKPRTCYICKMSFFRRHFFYEKLCPACGDFNYFKRIETSDLSGKIALVTGARVKIGYAAALRLLRAGATVIATSRFPHDTARRYATERDFGLWRERLHIYGLDLRHMGALAEFIEYLYRAYPKLDILVNNAAQTIRHFARRDCEFAAGRGRGDFAAFGGAFAGFARAGRERHGLFSGGQARPPRPTARFATAYELDVPPGRTFYPRNRRGTANQRDRSDGAGGTTQGITTG